MLGCVALLTGCEGATAGVERFYDSRLTPDRPVDWWHQLQGGPVAADRPPPPGVADPYPTFAAIPARPTPIDPATRRSLLTRMTTQRDQARRLATQDPLVWPIPGVPTAPGAPPPPKLAPAKTPTPAAPPTATDPGSSTLVFDAASASATSQAPPPRTQLDPAPPPAFARAQPSPTIPQPRSAPIPSGPIPAIPQDAPALPQFAGLPINTPIPVVLRAKPSAPVRFAPGASTLPPDAETALRTLAARRAGATIAVAAGGDARSAAPEAQRAALPLALRRTGAITAALIAAGVPPNAIRAQATAQGRDASARLLD